MNEYVVQHLKRLKTFLARWRGAKAQHWSSSASHGKMVFRLHFPGKFGNLHVTYMGTQHYMGPYEWDGCDIEIVALEEGGFAVSDKSVGFEVICTKVDVAENVKPLY